MLNLDTHLFLDAADASLSPEERSLLRRKAPFGISAIVLWEVEVLNRIGRIRYGLDHPLLVAMLESVQVWPLDVEVCVATGLILSPIPPMRSSPPRVWLGGFRC